MLNQVGKIDHNQRHMPMTARNMAMRKAWAKNLHQDIKDAAEKDPSKEFKVRHIVLPSLALATNRSCVRPYCEPRV